MPQWLEELRVIIDIPKTRKRVMYVDTCSGQNITPNVL